VKCIHQPEIQVERLAAQAQLRHQALTYLGGGGVQAQRFMDAELEGGHQAVGPFLHLHGEDIHHVQHGGVHGLHGARRGLPDELVRDLTEHDRTDREGDQQDSDDDRGQLLSQAVHAKHVVFLR
jgi:hypothetical protein